MFWWNFNGESTLSKHLLSLLLWQGMPLILQLNATRSPTNRPTDLTQLLSPLVFGFEASARQKRLRNIFRSTGVVGAVMS